MSEMFSAEALAEAVNGWCEQHSVSPASGQAGQQMTVRNIRYYRTLGLIDPPAIGGGHGFGDKHRLQLVAIRLLQAQGLPLTRIQELLYGRTVEDLKRIEKQGLAELNQSQIASFRPSAAESWRVTPLNDDFMLVSRHGRALSPVVRDQVLSILEGRRNGTGRVKRGN